MNYLLNKVLLFSTFGAFLFFATMTTNVAVAAEPSKHIESFSFLVDKDVAQPNQVSTALTNVNDAILDLGYQSALQTFSPLRVVRDYGNYNKEQMVLDIQSIYDQNAESTKSRSLGDALDYYSLRQGPVGDEVSFNFVAYEDALRQGAVIVFTDGDYSSSGRDSLNEVRLFYNNQPGMCLHFVSFAEDNSKEQALIDQMIAVNDCSVSARAESLNTPEGVQLFVNQVFDGSNSSY